MCQVGERAPPARRLSERWRDGLLGRTAEADDGRIFELLDRAEQAIRRPRTS